MAEDVENVSELEAKIRTAVINKFVGMAVSVYDSNMPANLTILSEIKRQANERFKIVLDSLVKTGAILVSERHGYEGIPQNFANRYSRDGVIFFVKDLWDADSSDIYREAGRGITKSDLETCPEDKREYYEIWASYYEPYKRFMDMHNEVINILIGKSESGEIDANEISHDDIKQAFVSVFPTIDSYICRFLERCAIMITAANEDHILLNSVNLFLVMPPDDNLSLLADAYSDFFIYANKIFASTYIEQFANRLNDELYDGRIRITIEGAELEDTKYL